MWEGALKVPGAYLAGAFAAHEAESSPSQNRWGISVNGSCFG